MSERHAGGAGDDDDATAALRRGGGAAEQISSNQLMRYVTHQVLVAGHASELGGSLRCLHASRGMYLLRQTQKEHQLSN